MSSAGLYLTATDLGEALSDVIPLTAEYVYPDQFPGYVGVEEIHRPTQAYKLPWASSDSMDNQGARIDYTSHGETGEVDRNAYSMTGPVEPNSVENFSLMGQVLPGQRRPEYGDGVVGKYDHNDYTTLSVAQQMYNMAYNEASLTDLLLHGNV